jgi:hypothetical protein
MSPQCKLSPYAAIFVASPISCIDSARVDLALSPHATMFVPVQERQTSPKSEPKLSPTATTVVATPAEKSCTITRSEALLQSLDPAVRTLLTHGVTLLHSLSRMKKYVAAVRKCQIALAAQCDALRRCSDQQFAFLKWKYFERYDESCTEQDIDSLLRLTETQSSRGVSLEMQQVYTDTMMEYARLTAEQDQAVDAHTESTRLYNAQMLQYYAHISDRSSSPARRLDSARLTIKRA